jgi:ATP-dependent Clp protease protease subunit
VINHILAERTGKNLAQIEKDTDRNFFMSAEEAKNYGLIDKVLDPRSKKDEKDSKKDE